MSSLTMPRTAAARPMPSALGALAGLLLPALILVLLGLSGRGSQPMFLWGGAVATSLGALILARIISSQPLKSPLTGLPGLVAAACAWLSRPADGDALAHVALGLLVLLPAGLFAGYALVSTGAPALRRARRIAAQIAARKEWPADLSACRLLPEVKRLRDAVREEAAPAMVLICDDRPAVRVAALAALESRRVWRSGQPAVVLAVARRDPAPEVRAAAALALAGVQQRLLLEELAECLRDPAPIVRKAAADALLRECDRRWIWVRHAVHEALADPRYARDGAIAPGGGDFNDQAIFDFAAWATEAGPLGVRATQTLALHYSQKLAGGSDPKLLAQLRDHVASPRSSAILRIELAHLLRQHGPFPPDLIEQLIDAANPSPLRLMAVDQLLQRGQDARAVDVLRQVARQPNRELALQAAMIVQKHLRIDLGLELGEPPPALHTRQAAEVTRRVIKWASEAPLTGSSMLAAAPPAAPASSAGAAADPLWDSLVAPPSSPKPAPASTPSPAGAEEVAPLEWD